LLLKTQFLQIPYPESIPNRIQILS